MRNRIWENDACREYQEMEANPAEYWPDEEEGFYENLTEEAKWEEVYDRIQTWFEDECANLNINTNGQIILTGRIVRWDGPRSAYKLLDTTNIGKAMKKAIQSFGNGDNYFEIYVEDGRMFISQTGHDNPTNPSIIEFRSMTCDFYEDLEDDRPETILRNSVSIAPTVCKVYGWEAEAAS